MQCVHHSRSVNAGFWPGVLECLLFVTAEDGAVGGIDVDTVEDDGTEAINRLATKRDPPSAVDGLQVPVQSHDRLISEVGLVAFLDVPDGYGVCVEPAIGHAAESSTSKEATSRGRSTPTRKA